MSAQHQTQLPVPFAAAMPPAGRNILELSSFVQLVQELIHGSVRRHTFSPREMELLFDLQNSRMRKTSRPEVLRRYLRAVQQRAAEHGEMLRLSSFLSRESVTRLPVLPEAV